MRFFAQYVISLFATSRIDYLTATAADLVTSLNEKTITSEQLVTAYLSRISQNNHQGLLLRAVLETAPYENVIEHARLYDKERRDGFTRGPLHGVPILVKDNIATDTMLGMNTTAGSFALSIPQLCRLTVVGSIVPRDATVINKLREAGAIIIGKANLSELSNFKGNITNGWSARGGQTQCAYVVGGYNCMA
jgi:amidase